MAVVSNVNVSPTLLMVHVDQLNRPLKMTNAAGTVVWSAVYQPWGAAHSIAGAESLDARFPGQWYQLEAGLNYNWHRHYDPSLGRYTQPDPLGFVDGPSVFVYGRNVPLARVDRDGRLSGGETLTKAGKALCRPCAAAATVIGISIAIYKYCTAEDDPPAPPPRKCQLAEATEAYCIYDCGFDDYDNVVPLRTDREPGQNCPYEIDGPPLGPE